MNILWANAGLLLPLDKGGKLRTWHLMRHLARRHAITWLSFAEPGAPREHLDGMREVAGRVVTVPRADVAKGSVQFYTDAARYLVDPLPYAVAKYRSRQYAQALVDLLRRERFDVIVGDFLPPVANMPQRLPCPSVLFTHNVEAEIWRRHVETARNPATRALLRTQWSRMLAFERAALARFDLVLTVSDADRTTFQRLYPGAARAYHVVPTGVDTEYFGPSTAAPDPTHLVFTGSMDWLPNEDAILHFCADILPRIRRAEPGVTFSIVGRAPTPAVRRRASEGGIEVTGRVDDVRPHVARGAVYVVPVRIGGGTRLKIFEAMALGKAIVSTTVGAEGLPVTDGRDILIADHPAAFAEAVVRLLRDVGERQRLETAARRLVVERYDWSAVAGEMEAALVGAAGGDAVATPSIEATA